MTEASPTSRPYFSIAIPAYNRADIIGRAIESCLSQTFADFEIVVCDDGSSDNTEQVVRAYADPRITYVRQANAGGGAARNHAAEVATGRYIAFLDSDDAFMPQKLAAFHDAIEAAGAPEAVVWYSPLCFYRGEGNSLTKPERPIAADETVGDYLFAYEGMMQTSTLVVPKPLFDTVRFDASLRNLQDLDLCLRLEAAGATFTMLPDELVIWYDVAVANRISYATKTDHITAWLDSRRPLLTDKAHAGFLARYIAPRIVRSEPIRATRLMADAVRQGAISPARAASVLVRGVTPGAYAWGRDLVVRLRTGKASSAN